MSVLKKPQVRKAAQLSVAAVVTIVCVAAGASFFVRRAAAPGPVEAALPTPEPPWRETADAALGKRISSFDAGHVLRAVWRCERNSCGFEGRYLVLTPKAGKDHDLRGAASLQALMGMLAPAFTGEIAWPALADGQAQAIRLPQGYAYVIVQSDRAGPAGGGPVAGGVIDRAVRHMVAQAGPVGVAPGLDRARAGAPPAPQAPMAPSMPVPEEPIANARTPSWR